MKKIIYITISMLVLFCCSAETAAMGNYKNTPEDYTISRAMSPHKQAIMKENRIPSVRFIKTETVPEKQVDKPVCCQTYNVAVLDSKQVKVTYDFWIVKFFKKLFEID